MQEKRIIVYYQPSCAFCVVCRHFIEKRVKNVEFVFFDLDQYKENEGRPTRLDSIVVIYENKNYFKYNACLLIARHISKPWPLISSILQIVPTKLGDFGYDVVANHRVVLMYLYRYFSHKK
jgi:predicted DCC family thiol-disulfide oxidoreductase YuxK